MSLPTLVDCLVMLDGVRPALAEGGRCGHTPDWVFYVDFPTAVMTEWGPEVLRIVVSGNASGPYQLSVGRLVAGSYVESRIDANPPVCTGMKDILEELELIEFVHKKSPPKPA
jgi:hypothetical protein